jgi:holo-[acyl-carrier protein] synthase
MLGIDIIEIDRIKEVVTSDHGVRFLQRVFTSQELDYCRTENSYRFSSLAARFAAKEAVSKALGTGIRSFTWTDIEVKNDDKGKPFVTLQNEALAEAINQNIKTVHISLSHTRKLAFASAYLEYDKK